MKRFRWFIVIAMVISGSVGLSTVTAFAYTTYHAYCKATNCQEAANGNLYLAAACDVCSTDSSKVVTGLTLWGASGWSYGQMLPTSLKATTSEGSYTPRIPSNCTYQHQCTVDVKGVLKTADLYAHWAYIVSITSSATSVRHGTAVALSGRVGPSSSGARVYLQRYYSSAWHNVTYHSLSTKSRYSFTVKPGVGTFKYRVYKPASTKFGGRASRVMTIKGT